MKTMQIMLRHRVAPIKGKAALRQMCEWINPAGHEYTATYDPLVAKWSAFEKDMADVRSQREGPLRWNPPSYINKEFLMLQQNQSIKSPTRGLRKRNSHHRPISHKSAKKEILDAQAVTLFKKTPDYETSVKNRSQEIEDDHITQKKYFLVDTTKKKDTFLRKTPSEVESSEIRDSFTRVETPTDEVSSRGETPSELPVQESLLRHVTFEGITDVKESNQKPARLLTPQPQTKRIYQNKFLGPKVSIKTKQYEYQEDGQMPQRVTPTSDMTKRRSHTKETFLRGNGSGNIEKSMEPAARESQARESSFKDLSITEESLEEAESATPTKQVPVKRIFYQEVPDNVDSFEEMAEIETLATERSKKGEEQASKTISRDTQINDSPGQDELNAINLLQEMALNIAPLQEPPKKITTSKERLDNAEKRNTSKKPLKILSSVEETIKRNPVVHTIQKSEISSIRDQKMSEDHGFKKSESQSADVYSSLEHNFPRKLREDIMLSSATDEELGTKESTTFSKKRYEALRKYIAEAEVELRVQKQMLSTQKEEFKRRLRKMALNPLAEIERNSKVHLQHPLDYFNQRNKIPRTGKRIQRKLNDKENITALHSKSIESTPAQSHQESSDVVTNNENSINMAAIQDDLLAEPNSQNTFAEPEVHKRNDNIANAKSRSNTNIQERSKEILDSFSSVESLKIPHSIQAHKKIMKQGKTQHRSKRPNISSDNVDTGEHQQEDIVDLQMSEKIRPSKNTKQTNNRNLLDDLESLESQEISTIRKVVPDHGRAYNVTRSHPTKEIYDYFDSDQSVLTGNQKRLKRKPATDSITDNSIKFEDYHERSRIKTKLADNPRDSQILIENPIRSDHTGPQGADNNSSLESREIQEITQQEFYKELKPPKGTGIGTSNQIRASSLLDRSRAKLQKHFMDRSAPIRLNKNTAYIYHPSESTISTMTKSSLGSINESEMPLISVLPTYTGSKKQLLPEENNIVKHEHAKNVSVTSDLPYLSQQPPTTKTIPHESNLYNENIEYPFSEEWDNSMTSITNNEKPVDYSATLKTLPQKDHTVPQIQIRNNSRKENKLPIPVTLNHTRNNYQEDFINKIDRTEESSIKPIPKYNYFNKSGDEMRPYGKNISLDNAKQYSRMEKTKFFSVNELSATGQTSAPENYDYLPEKSELSNNALKSYGSNNKDSLLELSKTDISHYNKQMRFGSGPISPASYLSNTNQPVLDTSGEMYSEYSNKSIDYTNPHEANGCSTTEHPSNFDTRHNPKRRFKPFIKPDNSNKSNTSPEKLYPPFQTTSRSMKSNFLESDFNNNVLKTEKRSFTSEINSRGPEVNDSLQDIEEGIPSSRVKLRPPLDAFTSFGVGQAVSEVEPSNPYPSHRSCSTDPHRVDTAPKFETMRSLSLHSTKDATVTTNTARSHSTKDASVTTDISRSHSHYPSRTRNTEVNHPSRLVLDRYPTLFKDKRSADPFNETFPFQFVNSLYSPPTKKKISSKISEDKSTAINLETNSLDTKHKKSIPFKISSTDYSKPKKPVLSETKLSHDPLRDVSFQEVKTVFPKEWPDKASQETNTIDSTYGNTVAHHNSYRLDPIELPQPGMLLSEQDKLDQSTRKSRSISYAALNSPQKTTRYDSNDTTITFHPEEIETLNRRKPALPRKPDTSKTKLRSRFFSPSSFDVENVDSFFRVKPIQLTGSPIRKWKKVPKERTRAIYVASIPQNRTLPEIK